jgi:hypothetical protein
MTPALNQLLAAMGDAPMTIPQLCRALPGLTAADIDGLLLDLHRMGLVAFTCFNAFPAWRQCPRVTGGEARR